MFNLKRKYWDVHDPDNILRSENLKSIQGKIYPREDLLLLKFMPLNISIDFGFYGDNADGGQWVVHVICEDGWETPLLIKRFDLFEVAINLIEELIAKYQDLVSLDWQ